jgi:hypothetical protein
MSDEIEQRLAADAPAAEEQYLTHSADLRGIGRDRVLAADRFAVLLPR